ncbi:hypothetical protein JYU07_00130 [Roseiflexus sp. AH-315-K22]|nr:hypothetical protein [Roseiflexus sp. AH-315-K22]
MRLASLDPSGTIRLRSATDSPWAVHLADLLLADDPTLPMGDLPSGTQQIWCRSGSGEAIAPGVPRWAASAWEAFDARCDALVDPLNERRLTLWFRPHADDMLCDAHACRAFLARSKGKPISIIADPTALLTAAMIETAPDHLVRIIETHAATPGVDALILTNVRIEGDGVVPTPLGEGVLDAGMLVDLVRTAWPGDRPVVLLEADLDPWADRLADRLAGPLAGGPDPTLAD